MATYPPYDLSALRALPPETPLKDDQAAAYCNVSLTTFNELRKQYPKTLKPVMVGKGKSGVRFLVLQLMNLYEEMVRNGDDASLATELAAERASRRTKARKGE
jgi:hypothetical protein